MKSITVHVVIHAEAQCANLAIQRAIPSTKNPFGTDGLLSVVSVSCQCVIYS